MYKYLCFSASKNLELRQNKQTINQKKLNPDTTTLCSSVVHADHLLLKNTSLHQSKQQSIKTDRNNSF